MGMRGPGSSGPGLRPGGGPGRPMGAPPPPPPSGGLLTRRKKADEDDRDKKKPAGKGVKKARTVEVDNELFTKGPFSGTQIINDDLGPEIVMPEPGEEESSTPRRKHQHAQPHAARAGR